jgi:cytochrome c551/c552
VFKRTWIVFIILAAFLSACGTNELAEDLTPIPTLPPGQTPELVAALQGSATEAATAEAAGTEEAGTAAATEEAGGATEEAATAEAGAADQVTGNADNGETLFNGQGCGGCHSVADDSVRVGPSLKNIANTAATRVEGMSAVEYLHQSIVEPDAHVVEGFNEGMMPSYAQLPESDANDLVAYLMTLDE